MSYRVILSTKSLYEYGKEHVVQYKNGAEESHMAKHMVLHHEPGVEPNFVLKPVRCFRTALERQISEAVRIRRCGAGVVLNSKSE